METLTREQIETMRGSTLTKAGKNALCDMALGYLDALEHGRPIYPPPTTRDRKEPRA